MQNDSLALADQAPPALIPGDQVPGEGQVHDSSEGIETQAAHILAKSTQDILLLLAGGMTAENAPQVLMKIQALAQTQRQLLPYFGGFVHPEQDPKRRQQQLNTSMGVKKRSRGGSAESHAARSVQELMAMAGRLQAAWTLPQTIRAVGEAKSAGMPDVAERLEKQVRDQMGVAGPGIGISKDDQDKVVELLTDHVDRRYGGHGGYSAGGISVSSSGYAVSGTASMDHGEPNSGLTLEMPGSGGAFIDPMDMGDEDDVGMEDPGPYGSMLSDLAEEGMAIGAAMSSDSGYASAAMPNPGLPITPLFGDIVGGNGQVYSDIEQLPPYVIGFEADGATLANSGSPNVTPDGAW